MPAPTAALLDNGGAAAGTSIPTNSISPTGGTQIAIWVFTGAAGAHTSTVTGLGLTFNSIVAIGTTNRIALFVAFVPVGTGSGALTITNTASAVTLWGTVQVTGALPNPTNSNRATNTGTSGTVTLTAYTPPSLVLFGCGHANNGLSTPESPWSEIVDFTSQSRVFCVIQGLGSGGDTTPSMSWTGSVAWAAAGVEFLDDTISLSESLAITEGATTNAVAQAPISESLSITEAVGSLVVALAPISESLTITEALTAVQPFVEPVVESLTITESVDAGVGSSTSPTESLSITEELYVEGGVEYVYPYNTQAAGGGSNAGYIASAATSSYEAFAAQQDPTPLQGLEEAWEGVPDLVEDAWERPDALGDAPPLEELGLEEPEHQEPLAGPSSRRARTIRYVAKKRGLAALGDLLPNPTSGAIGSGASTVAGYAAAKAGKMLLDKIDPQKPWLKKHGAVAAAAAATGVALAAATKIKFLREHRGEIALGGLLACLELASAAYGNAAAEQAIEIPDEHQTGIALVGDDEE